MCVCVGGGGGGAKSCLRVSVIVRKGKDVAL